MKPLHIIAIIIALAAGYFAGREHVKYEIRQSFIGAIGDIGKAFTSPIKETKTDVEKVAKAKAEVDRVSAEKTEYIKSHIVLYDMTTEWRTNILQQKGALLTGKIENTGNRSLNEVELTVYYMDKNGKEIADHNRSIVYVSDMIDSKALKPNYIQSFKVFNENCPVEWEVGKVKLVITNVEFATQ